MAESGAEEATPFASFGGVRAKARFVAGVVQTGTVLGLDANLPPHLVAETLGPGEEHRYGDILSRFYDLAEFVWRKRCRGLGWEGVHLAVQVGLLEFEELRDELARRQVELVEVGDHYWQPDAQTTVHVENGVVRKVFTAFRQDFPVRSDHKAVWQQVKAVAAMSENERIRWAGADAIRSWRYRTRLTARRTASHDVVSDRQTFVDLAFWMWDFGHAQGVFSAKEVALERAEFVARLDDLYPQLELPDSDGLVGDCLDHVSEDMTRADKNLVDAANLLRHNLIDTSRLDDVYRKRISRR